MTHRKTQTTQSNEYTHKYKKKKEFAKHVKTMLVEYEQQNNKQTHAGAMINAIKARGKKTSKIIRALNFLF